MVEPEPEPEPETVVMIEVLETEPSPVLDEFELSPVDESTGSYEVKFFSAGAVQADSEAARGRSRRTRGTAPPSHRGR